MIDKKAQLITGLVSNRRMEVMFPQEVRLPLGFRRFVTHLSPEPVLGKARNVKAPAVIFGRWKLV